MDRITVRGAREHNLKNINVTIPRDRLVVLTGISGSGKSSLAFDTIYAEGQRRYVESLSAYARQFLEQNAKPDVDSIEGLSPAIAIEQKTSGHNPRSTVGTLTEISDYMRVLYASIGEIYCPKCGKRIVSHTVQQMVDAVLALPVGTKATLLTSLVRDDDTPLAEALDSLRRDGFVRVRVNGHIKEIDEALAEVAKLKKATIEVVIDRLVIRTDLRTRLTDSVELALKRGDGALVVQIVDGEELRFSERATCCGIAVPELSPQLFSFNSPQGACVTCGGLGHTVELDPDRIVPDETLSIDEGAIKPWEKRGGFYGPQLKAVAKHFGFALTTPWKKLPKKARDAVLYGTGDTELTFKYESKKSTSKFTFSKAFQGVIPILMRKLTETGSDVVREELDAFMSKRLCPTCEGTRMKEEARMVRVGGLSIDKTNNLSVTRAIDFFDGLELDARNTEIAKPLTKEIKARLSFMQAVGLEYLSLDRASMTLSGGEAQRIRLATQVGSALQGVVYVLDEPSIGLHQRDNERLLRTLLQLRDLGNTVLVVEHDEDTIRAADHVIDIGPGAGVHGGHVVFAGTAKEIAACTTSLTGDYLSGRKGVAVPSKRRRGNGNALVLKNARGNNLKGVDAEIPLGCFVCVTGVSGSGKSTLVNDTLRVALARELGLGRDQPAPFDTLEGHEHLDKVIDIDQSPIGRTPRSNPSTYTGVFAIIRDLFAQLPEARARGYEPGRFSFNVKGGRCEACQGDGVIKIEMHFLPDVYVTCETCHGARYNRETLEILYKGKSIADVLNLTIDEAAEFLGAIPKAARKLETLKQVGLGYLTLGQSATTLSGGEAQRMKLATELSRASTGRTLYVLDEPTTGLHFYDVERLLEVLRELVAGGNTVLVIEHNLDVIKTADHVIDLGPEGGSGGGEIVATGTPEQIADHPRSHTGKFLKRVLTPSAASVRSAKSAAR